MTGEHLLNAMGLLDDDLIQEAEEYRRSRRGGGPWLGLAASFAVVLVLGYGAVRLGTVGGANNMSGGASAPAASAPAGGEPSASAPLSPEGGDSLPWGGQAGSAGDETELDRPSGEPLPQEPDASFTPPGAGSSEPEYYVVRICITDGATQYAYHCRFDGVAANDPQVEIPQLEALPEGCRSLGRLRQLETEEDFKLPYTVSGWYTGCPLWIQGEGWEGPVYLELPQGGYLVFEYSQTYDLSP